jgi:catechol 2,3-dioxygenase-like lactoylglutathione lyase family enzyme
MRLLHVALVRSSEAASDRFFQEVLGLARTRAKTASAALGESRVIFLADEDGNLYEIKERT